MLTQRRRGVESKLMVGGVQAERVDTLLRNAATGHRYSDLMCRGLTYAQVAEREMSQPPKTEPTLAAF